MEESVEQNHVDCTQPISENPHKVYSGRVKKAI